MIELKKERLWLRDRILKEAGNNPSVDALLDLLLDDGDYIVYRYAGSKRTFSNRLNLMWFMPLFIMTIPFQWLINGRVGISRNSWIGRKVDKFCKFI